MPFFNTGTSNDVEAVGFAYGCAANAPCGMGTPTASASPTSSSVTIGTGTLTLDITEGGATISHQFNTSGGDAGGTPGFITVNDASGRVVYNGSADSADPDNLLYVTYGSWTQAGATSGGYGGFASGTLTPTANMPITGSASYNGHATGLLAVGDGQLNLLWGTMSATANFGGQTPNVSGSANLNVTGDSVTAQNNTGFWNTVSFQGGISGNHFTGTASSPTVTSATSVLPTTAMTGGMSGAFYGPQATNIGGVFNLAGGHSQAVGAFGGMSQGIH